jgi:hypothetical protein
VKEAGQHAKTQTLDHQNIKQKCQQPNQILDLVTQTTSVTMSIIVQQDAT